MATATVPTIVHHDNSTSELFPAEVRRSALRLVTSTENAHDALFDQVLRYAKTTPEWSRTLTWDETTRWQSRLRGYADAVNRDARQIAAPMPDAYVPVPDIHVEEMCARIAGWCARFSHQRSQQRSRAYKRAESVRAANRYRDQAILRDRVAGDSLRVLAARYELSMGGVRWVLGRNR